MPLDLADVARLRHLEETLWRPETRFDRALMEATFAPDFFEIGRSGRIWTREQCIDHEPVDFSVVLPLPGFEARQIAPDVALVIYVSEAMYGDIVERARRSSLWKREGGDWRLRYHQGTPLPEGTRGS